MDPGSVISMKRELEIMETVEERQLGLRLILMYKVVEGLVPSLLKLDLCDKTTYK